MSYPWQQNIAGIFADDSDTIVGTGALVRAEQCGLCILTCAHALNEARQFDPYNAQHHGDHRFRFWLPAQPKPLTATLIEWHPPRKGMDLVRNPVSDVALLQLEPGVEVKVKPYHLNNFKVIDLDQQRVISFGFSNVTGKSSYAVLEGGDNAGRLQIASEDEHRSFIAPGFSGAPLFDEKRRNILGMVVSLSNKEGERTAYAISTKILWTACPQLARPYKGLEEFDEDDADFFFGRDAFIEELNDKLSERPIIGVTGDSGMGKSSVVKAGLIPQLRKQRNWCIIQMRPDKNPWERLASALVREIYPTVPPHEIKDLEDKIATELRQDPASLHQRLKAFTGKNPGIEHVLILVNQFEELFTLAGHPDSIDGDFRDLMVASATVAGSPTIQWVYTLRADFSGKAFGYRLFRDALGDGDVKLAEMTEKELRQAIVNPAQALNVDFAQGIDGSRSLAERIADAVSSKSRSLPLMGHLLEKLWERMASRELSFHAYDAMDGLEGALNLHADETLTKLKPRQQELTRRLFSQLVKISNDGGGVTRRIRTRAELGEDLWEVAGILAQKRLLTIRGREPEFETGADYDETGGQKQNVEVAHEALLTHWKIFAETWLPSDRSFVLWQQRMEQGVNEWKRNGALLNKRQIVEAREWRGSRYGEDINSEQNLLIEASEAAEKRKRNILVVVAAGIVGLVVFFGGMYLNSERKALVDLIREQEKTQIALETAETEKNNAKNDAARFAAAIASGLHQQGKPISALLVVRNELGNQFSYERSDEKLSALVELSRSVSVLDEQSGILSGHEGSVNHATFSPDGIHILTASSDNTARVWDASSGAQVHELKGHRGIVSHAAFSPDGNRIITTSWDNTARLWDTNSGAQMHVLEGHNGIVIHAAFSPDGSRIITASDDNTARLWDATSGVQVHELKGYEDSSTHTASGDNITRGGGVAGGAQALGLKDLNGPVNRADFSSESILINNPSDDNPTNVSVVNGGAQVHESKGYMYSVTHAAFSPDGSRIITTSSGNTARLWDAGSGDLVHELKGHEGIVNHAAFSPDGSRLVTASSDNTARLWNAITGNLVHELKGHEGIVSHAAFSPDGNGIITTSDDNTPRLWDVSSGDQVQELKGHKGSVAHAAFSPDGSRIITASSDNTARLWDAITGDHVHELKDHERPVKYAAFSSDGSRIITASSDNTARLWDATSGAQVHVLKSHEDTLNHAAFSPDGMRIITVSDDDTARLWDTANGALVHELNGHERPVRHAAFSPDGSRIVTSSLDNTARLWDAGSGDLVLELEGHEYSVTHAAFSPDGSRIITASWDKTARVWDASSGTQVHELKGHKGIVSHATFSPDGSRIITVSDDNTARLWNTAKGVLVHKLEGHKGSVTHAAFSPNGSRIITASRDKTARLWDTTSGALVHKLEGHKGTVKYAAFSPDGIRIITASWDNTARLWEASDGAQVHELKGHEGIVNHAAFSPDGSRIVTASDDNTARLWDVISGTQLHELKGHKRPVIHAAFSPDGTRIITASWDKTARLWNTGPKTPVLDSKGRIVMDENGHVQWRLHRPFSQGLFDRADQLVSRKLTKGERSDILKEK